MLPATTIGSKSMSNCDGEWPAAFSIPPNLGPAIDPILPMATAAPTPTPRMLVGYTAGAIAYKNACAAITAQPRRNTVVQMIASCAGDFAKVTS